VLLGYLAANADLSPVNPAEADTVHVEASFDAVQPFSKTLLLCWRLNRVHKGSGLWYRIGQGLVPVEWGFVRDEYFYCTQPGVFTAAQIVSYYTQRWTIEVTFQELRAHLGFETTRKRVVSSVLRMAPCLMGLFSVITLIYHEHLKRNEPELSARPAYEKTEPTFSDAIATVRRLLWSEIFFQQPYFRRTFKNIPPKMRSTILTYLSQAV